MKTRKYKRYKVATVSYPADYWGKEIVAFFATLCNKENFYLTQDELKKMINIFGEHTKIKTVSGFLTAYCAATKWEVLSVSKNLLESNEKTYTITFIKNSL